MSLTYLKAYVPASWFHPIGIHKVLKRFWHRLPNVANCLFVTYTIDREAMRAQGYGPSEAFDITRDRIRRIYHRLREGVNWEGKTYKIKAAYCTKVEFHADEEGWPHFHCIWLTRQFVPADLLAHLWSYGRTNVKRIENDKFHYLLKYVSKSGKVPEWVQEREKMRIFQPSHGFLQPEEKPRYKKNESEEAKSRVKTTIRQRLNKWSHMATLVTEITNKDTTESSYVQLHLLKPFQELFDRLILSVALDGRYKGNGLITINRKDQLEQWQINLTPNMSPPA